MAVVKQLMIDRIINYMDDLIARGKVKLNGQYVNYQIFKTVKEENVLREYIYLETETGYVEEAQLLTNGGDVLAAKPFEIEKGTDGLVLAFEFTITVEEG